MNPFELLKNMNEIKSQAEAMKAKVATIRCTGYAGGNMVQAVANGKMEIESVTIDPEFAKAENTQRLEVLVTSAVTTALANVRERIQEAAANAMAQSGIGL